MTTDPLAALRKDPIRSNFDSGWNAALDAVERATPPAIDPERLAARVAAALSEERHRLVRAAPDGVACICGQYDDSDHGIEAASLWRDHLIGAARAAIIAAYEAKGTKP